MSSTNREMPSRLESTSHEMISITLPQDYGRSYENEETCPQDRQPQTSASVSGGRPPLTINITIARQDHESRYSLPPMISIEPEQSRPIPPHRLTSAVMRQLYPRVNRETAPSYSENDPEAPKTDEHQLNQGQEDDFIERGYESASSILGSMPSCVEVLCVGLFLAMPVREYSPIDCSFCC